MAFAIDGLSGLALAVLALTGVAGGLDWRRWVVVAAAMLGVAVDGAGLVVGLAAAAAAAVGLRVAPRGWWLAGGAVACVEAAVLAFGARNGAEGIWGAAGLAAVVGAAAMLPFALPGGVGGVMAVFVVARLLLDVAGAGTPGWWGVPVLALGSGGAVWGAWRMAGAGDLGAANEEAGRAALGVAVMGLGAALLARGADLQPLAALAVAGALLQVLAWGLWSGLATVCERAMRPMGGPELSRLGGLLRRSPATGLALLVALASMAAVPATAGFAGAWTVEQAVLGASRAGGTAALLLVAGGVSAWGLAWALLAGGAVRVGGAVLLGSARGARAAAAVEPRRRVRLGMAVWSVAVLLLGLCPGAGLLLLRPAVQRLSGAVAEGAGLGLVAGSVEGPGYAAPVLAVLLVGSVVAAAWVARSPAARVRPWRGGSEEGVDALVGGPVLPGWWAPGSIDWGRVARFGLLGGLGAALCVALGWVVR